MLQQKWKYSSTVRLNIEINDEINVKLFSDAPKICRTFRRLPLFSSFKYQLYIHYSSRLDSSLHACKQNVQLENPLL
jgi:hypothetical protein